MPYSAQISRTQPACFLFLIDQSYSMKDEWGGEEGKTKSESLADIVNRLLMNLIIRCSKEEGVRHYFDVGVIGYGQNVQSAFVGSLAGKELAPISEVAEAPARVEDRTKKISDDAGGLVDQTVKFPIWFDPIANGGTPMCHAIMMSERILSSWIDQHRSSFPPIVFNITDGASSDGNPSIPARDLTNLATDDGNLLLFNIHLSSSSSTPILLPSSTAELPNDEYARSLFEFSSMLPDSMRVLAQQEGMTSTVGARGFVFNADPVAVIQFLDIGTRSGELR